MSLPHLTHPLSDFVPVILEPNGDLLVRNGETCAHCGRETSMLTIWSESSEVVKTDLACLSCGAVNF